MSLNGEDRLNDGDVEYNHRNESGDEESENSGQTIEVIREIFTPKETGIKVNPQRNLFPSPAEEYFNPTKQSKKTYISPRRSSQNWETRWKQFDASIPAEYYNWRQNGEGFGTWRRWKIKLHSGTATWWRPVTKKFKKAKKYNTMQSALKICYYHKFNRNHLFGCLVWQFRTCIQEIVQLPIRKAEENL